MPLIALLVFLMLLLVLALVMVMVLAGLVFFLLACLGILLVTGIVLVAVGIFKRRKKFWISGLVIILIVALLMAASVPAVLYCGYRYLKAEAASMHQGSDENMRQWFKDATGLQLPPKARYIAGKDVGGWLSTRYLKLQVPLEYMQVLAACLGPQLSGDMPSRLEDLPTWYGMAECRNLVYYEITTRDATGGGFVTVLALDPQTGILFCVSDEYAP